MTDTCFVIYGIDGSGEDALCEGVYKTRETAIEKLIELIYEDPDGCNHCNNCNAYIQMQRERCSCKACEYDLCRKCVNKYECDLNTLKQVYHPDDKNVEGCSLVLYKDTYKDEYGNYEDICCIQNNAGYYKIVEFDIE